MANEVRLTIRVGDDGSLGVVAKQAEKAAKATDKVRQSTDAASRSKNHYNKLEKGTAQLGANTTKSFAKQAQTVGSGLVPAYAALAANVFAITAAFGALQRAAQVEQLVQGFTFLGNEVGRTAIIVAESLTKITDNALSLEQALRAASSGFSAGFSTSEMERLAQVAKNAAQALGRDVGDATDRVFRGVAKLEPEILDELGIFIKIDRAAQKYAASLGVAATTLTETERRQAFLNEALTQGERKFGALTGEVQTNPYDKLAASFNNLAKAFFAILNEGLTPIINFFSNNMVAFTGAIVLFGSTVARQMIPALDNMGDKAVQNSIRSVAAAEATMAAATQSIRVQEKSLADINTPLRANNKYFGIKKAIIAGTAATADFKAGIKQLEDAIKRKNKRIQEGKNLAQNKADIVILEQELALVKRINAERAGQGEKQILADVKETEAIAGMLAADRARAVEEADGILGAFSVALAGTREYSEEVNEATKKAKDLGKFSIVRRVFGGLIPLFKKAGVAVRLFGIAVLRLVPVIGQVLFFGGILLGFLKKLFTDTSKTKEALDKLNTVLDTIAEKRDQFDKQAKRMRESAEASNAAATAGAIYSKQLQIQSGFTKEFTDSLISANEALLEETQEVGFFGALTWWATSGIINVVTSSFDTIVSKLGDIKTEFVETAKAFRDWAMRFGVLADLSKWVDNFTEQQSVARLEQKATSQIQESYNKALKEGGFAADFLRNKFGAGDGLVNRFKELRNEGKTVAQALEIVNEELRSVADEASRRSGNINELGGSFENLTAALIKFREAEAGKDKYLELSGQIEERINLLNRILEDEGSANFANIVAAKFEEGTLDLRQFGITLEQIQTEGADALVPLNTQFRELSDLTNTIKLRTDRLNLEQKFHAARIQAAKINVELMNINETFSRFGVSQVPGLDYFDSLSTTYENALSNAEQEYTYKKAIADMQFMMMEKELDLQETLNAGNPERLEAIRKQRIALDAAKTASDKLLESQRQNAQDASYIQYLKNQEQQRSSFLSSIEEAETTADKINLLVEAIGKAKAGNAVGDALSGVFDIIGKDEEGNEIILQKGLQERLDMIKSFAKPMVEELKKLGPEGEAVSAAVQGAFMVMDAFITFGDSIKNVMEDVSERTGKTFESMKEAFAEMTAAERFKVIAAGLQLIAQAFAGLNTALQAQTRQRISVLDDEIEAEKRRDGKSAESVARIEQMEKKKDQIKRKQFETDKKVKIAMAIANTASGIAAVLPLMGVPGMQPLAISIMAMIGAIGAAQIAILSGLSYQGGGSKASASSPTGIAVGSRNNEVDLARSQGGAGELGYMRGESGTGGPENFRRGFAGLKYRAEGGSTGIVVGEQGPELFVPSTPGRVVPNDDIAASNQNINFSINAVDAAGVEELLVNQRGNIIGMLREASNSYGEPFMEKVNTQVYSSQGGVPRYGER